MAPTESFSFLLKSKDEIKIAKSGVDPEVVTNDAPFILPPSAFEAQPQVNELGAETDYRIAFFPETYVTDMVLKIKLPDQIDIVDQTVECISLSSNVDDLITCEIEEDSGKIIVSNAFTTSLYDQSKGMIFSVGTLRNPASLQTTESFEIETLTQDGYLIDQRTEDLVINFDCLLPCRTCLEGSNNQCASCFTADTQQSLKSILHEGSCIETCPISSVALADQTCAACYDEGCEACDGPD